MNVCGWSVRADQEGNDCHREGCSQGLAAAWVVLPTIKTELIKPDRAKSQKPTSWAHTAMSGLQPAELQPCHARKETMLQSLNAHQVLHSV